MTVQYKGWGFGILGRWILLSSRPQNAYILLPCKVSSSICLFAEIAELHLQPRRVLIQHLFLVSCKAKIEAYICRAACKSALKWFLVFNNWKLKMILHLHQPMEGCRTHLCLFPDLPCHLGHYPRDSQSWRRWESNEERFLEGDLKAVPVLGQAQERSLGKFGGRGCMKQASAADLFVGTATFNELQDDQYGEIANTIVIICNASKGSQQGGGSIRCCRWALTVNLSHIL